MTTKNRTLSLRLLAIPFTAFILSIPHAAAQRDSKTVQLIAGEKTLTIPAFEHNRQTYVSLTHVAQSFALRSYADTEKSKVEFVIGEKRLKLTENNPFIVVISHKTNAIDEVFQLPFEVISSGKAFYIPIEYSLPLLARTWKPDIAWNQDDRTLSFEPSTSKTKQKETTPAQAQDPVKSGEGDLAPKEVTEEVRTVVDIPRLTVDARKNGTLVRIHSNKHLTRFHSKPLSGSVLAVEIPNVSVDENELRQTPISGEDLVSVTARQEGKNAVIEFRMHNAVQAEDLTRDAANNDLLLLLYRKAEVQKIFSEEQQGKSKKTDKSKKWALDVIVIDAGHGGKDPGAISLSGVKEKNITLGISLKVGEMIEKKMKGVKVVYTRKDDTFIELYRRGKIANEAGGKLFISIHCNSTEKKPTSANGFEVYLLRPGRTEEAIRIAEFENSVIKFEQDYEERYKNLSNENFIIASMAHSAYVKYSERFAEMLHTEVKASRNMKSLGVKQAGFYVLVGASMPGVLIETGFLSNAKDDAFLASQDGQNYMAKLIYNAIEKFAEEYQKSLKE